MIIDGTNGLTFNNSTTQASAGQVLQVVNATYATAVTSSSSSFTDTGLTANITPKFASSKILVLVQQNGCGKDTGNTSLALNLLRNSTTISAITDITGNTSSTATNVIGGVAISYLDSPATTSSTTYKTQLSSQGNIARVYVQGAGSQSSVSTITLMEIAG
jgi:hypothetical protein